MGMQMEKKEILNEEKKSQMMKCMGKNAISKCLVNGEKRPEARQSS